LALTGGALLIAAVLALGLGYNPYASQSQIPAPGWWLGATGLIMIWRAIFH
jgi:multisubunit Na+/H+ antiporter MnhB subunit